MAEQETHKHDTHVHHETHEHHADHEMHASTAAKPSDNKTMTWIAFIAALLIVAVVSYTLGTHSVPAGNASQQQSPSVINSNYGSQQPTSSVLPQQNTTLTKINASSVSYFILPSQAQELLGPSNHTAYAATTPAQLGAAVPNVVPNGLAYNVTTDYVILYSTTSTSVTGGLQELLFVTKQSKALYADGMNLYKNIFFNESKYKLNANITNSSLGVNLTSGAMTYSYASFTSKLPTANALGESVILIGYSNNITAFVQVSLLNTTTPINQSKVASIVASRLG